MYIVSRRKTYRERRWRRVVDSRSVVVADTVDWWLSDRRTTDVQHRTVVQCPHDVTPLLHSAADQHYKIPYPSFHHHCRHGCCCCCCWPSSWRLGCDVVGHSRRSEIHENTTTAKRRRHPTPCTHYHLHHQHQHFVIIIIIIITTIIIIIIIELRLSTKK